MPKNVIFKIPARTLSNNNLHYNELLADIKMSLKIESAGFKQGSQLFICTEKQYVHFLYLVKQTYGPNNLPQWLFNFEYEFGNGDGHDFQQLISHKSSGPPKKDLMYAKLIFTPRAMRKSELREDIYGVLGVYLTPAKGAILIVEMSDYDKLRPFTVDLPPTEYRVDIVNARVYWEGSKINRNKSYRHNCIPATH